MRQSRARLVLAAAAFAALFAAACATGTGETKSYPLPTGATTSRDGFENDAPIAGVIVFGDFGGGMLRAL